MRVRKQMRVRKTLLNLMIVTALVAAASVIYTGRTAARAPRPTAVELIRAGAVTLSPSQGMRINLVNALETSTIRTSVKFVDKSGQVLKAEELSLEPGSTSIAPTFVVGDSSAGTVIPAVQGPIHVIVESVPDAPEAPFPYVIPSLEVFERKAGKVEYIHIQNTFFSSNALRIGG